MWKTRWSRIVTIASLSVAIFLGTREVSDLGAEILICGAISLTLETAITAAGIDVYSFICGNIEEIVAAILEGDLENPRFLMPGRYVKGKRARL